MSPVIHIVDDDQSFRNAIADLLSACGYRVAVYDSAIQLLESSLDSEPACILLDEQMPTLSGTQLQNRLATLGCRLPIVFITGNVDTPTIVRAMKAGAEDFLSKPVQKEKLLAAIERALVRFVEKQAQNREIVGLHSLLSRLTPRENDVFALLVRGRPHKQIAHALGTTERTVKMHRHNVMQKCRVKSLAELAVIAERLGLLAATGAGSGTDLKAANTSTQEAPGLSPAQHP